MGWERLARSLLSCVSSSHRSNSAGPNCSLSITSNLVFSQWEHIFANPMATAAAIDRVVHHSVILEFDVPSYRTGVAQQRGREQEVDRQE